MEIKRTAVGLVNLYPPLWGEPRRIKLPEGFYDPNDTSRVVYVPHPDEEQRLVDYLRSHER